MTATERRQTIFWLFASLLTSIFSLNCQSFWIDECVSAELASLTSLRDVWERAYDYMQSDIQMPLYVFYSWCWEKIFGSGELILRASNIPWLFLGGYFLRKKPYALVLYLLSPFVIYYVGEFRVYAMQMAGGVWVASVLFGGNRREGDGINLNSFYFSSLLLCSASLTSALWSVGAFCSLLFMEKDRLKTPDFLKTTVKWAGPFIILGGYYFFTVFLGANPARFSSLAIMNILMSCYEIAGAAGLGPGRREARESLASVLPFIPYLCLFAFIVIPAFFVSFRQWGKKYGRRDVIGLMIAVGLPFVFLAIMNEVRDFRFSGRHTAPLFGYYIIVLTYWFTTGTWSQWNWMKRGLYICVCALFLFSSFQIRFAQRFLRDDYRGAVSYANGIASKGGSVVILANGSGIDYYTPDVRILPRDEMWINFPDEVLFNRPSDYDRGGFIKKLKATGKYEERYFSPGFKILVRQ